MGGKMSDLIPDLDDDQYVYSVKAKGNSFKPNYWRSHVIAKSEDDAKELIQNGYEAGELNLGLLGIKWVKVLHMIDPDTLEDRIRNVASGNAVVFRTENGYERIHRGQLREEDD